MEVNTKAMADTQRQRASAALAAMYQLSDGSGDAVVEQLERYGATEEEIRSFRRAYDLELKIALIRRTKSIRALQAFLWKNKNYYHFNPVNIASAMSCMEYILRLRNRPVRKELFLWRATKFLTTRMMEHVDADAIDPRSLVLMLWSLGEMRALPPSVNHRLMAELDVLVEAGTQFSPPYLAMIIRSAHNAGALSRDLVALLEPQLSEALLQHRFTATELTSLFRDLSNVGVLQLRLDLVQQLKEAIVYQLSRNTMRSGHIAIILRSSAMSNVLDRRFYDRLLESLLSQLSEEQLKAQEGGKAVPNVDAMAAALWSAVLANYRDRDFFRAMEPVLYQGAKYLSVEGLALALWGCARGQVFSNRLKKVLTQQLRDSMVPDQRIPFQVISDIFWATSALGVLDRDLYNRLYAHIQGRELQRGNHIEPRHAAVIMAAAGHCNLLDAQLCDVLLGLLDKRRVWQGQLDGRSLHTMVTYMAKAGVLGPKAIAVLRPSLQVLLNHEGLPPTTLAAVYGALYRIHPNSVDIAAQFYGIPVSGEEAPLTGQEDALDSSDSEHRPLERLQSEPEVVPRQPLIMAHPLQLQSDIEEALQDAAKSVHDMNLSTLMAIATRFGDVTSVAKHSEPRNPIIESVTNQLIRHVVSATPEETVIALSALSRLGTLKRGVFLSAQGNLLPAIRNKELSPKAVLRLFYLSGVEGWMDEKMFRTGTDYLLDHLQEMSPEEVTRLFYVMSHSPHMNGKLFNKLRPSLRTFLPRPSNTATGGSEPFTGSEDQMETHLPPRTAALTSEEFLRLVDPEVTHEGNMPDIDALTGLYEEEEEPLLPALPRQSGRLRIAFSPSELCEVMQSLTRCHAWSPELLEGFKKAWLHYSSSQQFRFRDFRQTLWALSQFGLRDDELLLPILHEAATLMRRFPLGPMEVANYFVSAAQLGVLTEEVVEAAAPLLLRGPISTRVTAAWSAALASPTLPKQALKHLGESVDDFLRSSSDDKVKRKGGAWIQRCLEVDMLLRGRFNSDLFSGPAAQLRKKGYRPSYLRGYVNVPFMGRVERTLKDTKWSDITRHQPLDKGIGYDFWVPSLNMGIDVMFPDYYLLNFGSQRLQESSQFAAREVLQHTAAADSHAQVAKVLRVPWFAFDGKAFNAQPGPQAEEAIVSAFTAAEEGRGHTAATETSTPAMVNDWWSFRRHRLLRPSSDRLPPWFPRRDTQQKPSHARRHGSAPTRFTRSFGTAAAGITRPRPSSRGMLTLGLSVLRAVMR